VEDRYDGLPELVAELASRRVDVIAAAGVPSARAAKTATSIIPIVFTRVGEDLVAGLAHVALTAIRGQNAPTKAGRVLDEDQRRLELLWEGPGRPNRCRLGTGTEVRRLSAGASRIRSSLQYQRYTLANRLIC
jgi:hypothetical protein